MIAGIRRRLADEAIVTVPYIQHGRRVYAPYLVERELTRNEEEEFAGRDVAEVIVVVAASIVPACAPKHPVLRADVLIDANRVGSVLRPLLEIWLPKITGSIGRRKPGRRWLWPILLDERLGDRVDQSGINDVVGKRILLKSSAGNRSSCEWIVDLILRAGLQQLREIAAQHGFACRRWGPIVSRTRIADSFISPKDESLVPSVVQLGYANR